MDRRDKVNAVREVAVNAGRNISMDPERYAKMAQQKDFDKEYPWGVLRVSYSDERYRLEFDGKPEQDVIRLLKEYCFKWSPKNQAWQRQITSRSTSVVKRVIIPTLNAICEHNKKKGVV